MAKPKMDVTFEELFKRIQESYAKTGDKVAAEKSLAGLSALFPNQNTKEVSNFLSTINPRPVQQVVTQATNAPSSFNIDEELKKIRSDASAMRTMESANQTTPAQDMFYTDALGKNLAQQQNPPKSRFDTMFPPVGPDVVGSTIPKTREEYLAQQNNMIRLGNESRAQLGLPPMSSADIAGKNQLLGAVSTFQAQNNQNPLTMTNVPAVNAGVNNFPSGTVSIPNFSGVMGEEYKRAVNAMSGNTSGIIDRNAVPSTVSLPLESGSRGSMTITKPSAPTYGGFVLAQSDTSKTGFAPTEQRVTLPEAGNLMTENFQAQRARNAGGLGVMAENLTGREAAGVEGRMVATQLQSAFNQGLTPVLGKGGVITLENQSNQSKLGQVTSAPISGEYDPATARIAREYNRQINSMIESGKTPTMQEQVEIQRSLVEKERAFPNQFARVAEAGRAAGGGAGNAEENAARYKATIQQMRETLGPLSTAERKQADQDRQAQREALVAAAGSQGRGRGKQQEPEELTIAPLTNEQTRTKKSYVSAFESTSTSVVPMLQDQLKPENKDYASLTDDNKKAIQASIDIFKSQNYKDWAQDYSDLLARDNGQRQQFTDLMNKASTPLEKANVIINLFQQSAQESKPAGF